MAGARGGEGGGSSPLVRGSGYRPAGGLIDLRFIPARAGIGPHRQRSVPLQTVHPRSCGDRSIVIGRRMLANGSSPLVRGSERVRLRFQLNARFIPARAGIGPHRQRSMPLQTVHPRSCGDRRRAWALRWHLRGSSPLVRGSGSARVAAGLQPRFIPARAGIGICWLSLLEMYTVHPRSCGDRSIIIAENCFPNGSSPLVRGSASVSIAHVRWLTVHPRSCGDRIHHTTGGDNDGGSSPLVRGSGR
ncbi:MAG: hypothetical protein XD36_0452 [Halomonas sp. 54_146]|nr:MAG: hypothetical protein XD36_0452 [Halomonas sp. 54_146]